MCVCVYGQWYIWNIRYIFCITTGNILAVDTCWMYTGHWQEKDIKFACCNQYSVIWLAVYFLSTSKLITEYISVLLVSCWCGVNYAETCGLTVEACIIKAIHETWYFLGKICGNRWIKRLIFHTNRRLAPYVGTLAQLKYSVDVFRHKFIYIYIYISVWVLIVNRLN